MVCEYVIGVDIGTQGTKAALYDGAGNCLSHALRKSTLYRPRPGIVEEDPEKQLASVCQAIRQCVRESGIANDSIGAIGLAGQMAGIIGVDTNGKNITPYDSWLDTRCSPYIEKMERVAGDEILKKTGWVPSFNHGPKILWWQNERRKIYNQIASFVQPAGYAAMRLCGLDSAKAFLDRTYLHFSGFADNHNSQWDLNLCKLLGVDPGKLPAIVEPEEIIGQMTAAMAKKCGLKPNTPVIAGCGDTAASFLACGAVKKGICVDVAGTASVFAATTDRFQADKTNRTLGCAQSVIKGLWHPYAYINGGGMNLEWFRKELVNAGGKAVPDITFDELNTLAGKLPVEENIPMFIPHFGGRVCPPVPNLRGSWVGLCWNHKIEHLYRAILESVALEYGIYNEILHSLYPTLKIKEIRITGGGGKSSLWNRIKSAVLQIPVVEICQNQGASMGAAMLAGVGIGIYDTIQSISDKWIKTDLRFTATAKEKKIYQQKVYHYKKVLNSLSQI